ncbi:MAG: LCP family protein, partial [Clostridiales bacterium]|nr:LCP family protein [Clostridiales bacterium]
MRKDIDNETVREDRRHRSIGCAIFATVCGVIVGITIACVILVAMFSSQIKAAINRADSVDTGVSGQTITEPIEGKKPLISNKAGHKEDFLTAIIAGTDEDGTRTDTILIAAFDLKNDTLSLLSIPRDTRTYMDNGKYHKINAAHNKGIKQMQKEIKSVIGFVPDKYMIINYTAFEELIDFIGGVEIDVEQDMIYSDPDQDLNINIKAGYQTLNGEQALHYMRYRSGYADADLGRIKAQQKLMFAVAKKAMKPSIILKLPGISEIFGENVETDLTIPELVWIGTKFARLGTDGLTTDMLPG